MLDNLGRNIDYMRISVTDRCNLRCRYCMPEEGVTLMSHEDILSFEEILRISCLAAQLGIRKIKITGGEPLARKGVEELIRSISAISGIEDVTMTSNGCLLSQTAKALAASGLTCVNISLDTLSPERFAYLTRREAFTQVMEGIEAAKQAGIPVKINCAVMDTLTREDVLAFAELSIRHQIPVRFIEMMPIGQGRTFEALDNRALLQILREKYPDIRPSDRVKGNGPAVYYEFGYPLGYVGFISAVHHKFCGSCNRVRLTSDGFLKLCLDSDEGIDLRALMREGAEDNVLRAAMETAIAGKPKSHHFGEPEDGRRQKQRLNMNQIGG